MIVLDADGVLWAGVAGDHTHPFYNVQQTYFDMVDPLILLTRNTEAHIREAFVHPTMVLTMDDFVEVIYEADKVKELTRLLTTYPDLTYVDDERKECARIRAALPGLRVVYAPSKNALGVAREIAGRPALPKKKR